MMSTKISILPGADAESLNVLMNWTFIRIKQNQFNCYNCIAAGVRFQFENADPWENIFILAKKHLLVGHFVFDVCLFSIIHFHWNPFANTHWCHAYNLRHCGCNRKSQPSVAHPLQLIDGRRIGSCDEWIEHSWRVQCASISNKLNMYINMWPFPLPEPDDSQQQEASICRLFIHSHLYIYWYIAIYNKHSLWIVSQVWKRVNVVSKVWPIW